jgi:hemoglobin/transferrin/lactoferrin receptor protein
MRHTLRVVAGRAVAGLVAVGSLPIAVAAQEAVPLDGVVVTTSKTPKRAVDTPSASSSVGGGGSRKAIEQAAPAAAAEFPASIAPVDGFGANGKSQFDKIQASSVTDLVRDIPGVTTSISPRDPAQSVNIRGLQDFGRVNVLVDGARQNFQRSGHNANGSFYLEPEFISSIDVTRGPSANLYGSGAIGGVMAINTRGIDDVLRADENAAIVEKIGFGSNGAGFLNSTSGGLRVGRNVDLFGQFVGRDTSSYETGDGVRIPDTGYEDFGGLGKIAVRPAAGHEVTATAMVQDYDFVNSLFDSPNSPTRTRRDSDVETENYTLGYTFARPDTPLVEFSAKTYYTTTDTHQKQLSPIPLINPDRQRDFEIETTGVDVSNTSRFQTGLVGHRLTYGADAFEDRVKVEDTFGTADLFTPSGERTVWGTFIEDEVQLTPWFKAIGALRYDNYELDGGSTSKDGDRVSPKGTVAVTPFTGIEVYGTYAEGYRTPALTETIISGQHPTPSFNFLPNPDLDPEVGKTKEFGVNLKYDNIFARGDKLRGKASIFRNDVEDFIDLTSFGPALVPCGIPQFACPPGSAQYVNLASARIEGFEFELGYDWGKGFANLSGTVTDSEDRETGLALVTVPPSRVSATLGFRFLNGRLIAGARAHFVEASEKDVQELASTSIFLPTDGYALLDLFGSYQFNDWSALDLAVNNVTDVRYRKYLDQEDSAGLQARAALTIKFGDKTGPLSSTW